MKNLIIRFFNLYYITMYHFTFGKFKDRLICDVFEEDPNYIAWITKKKWFKQRFTMEHKECLILMNTATCPPIGS